MSAPVLDLGLDRHDHASLLNLSAEHFEDPRARRSLGTGLPHRRESLRGHRTRKPVPLAGDPQRARERLHVLRRVNRAIPRDSPVSQRHPRAASSSASGTYIAARYHPFQHHPGSAMLGHWVARKALRHALHRGLLVSAEVPPIDTVFPRCYSTAEPDIAGRQETQIVQS